MATMGGMAALLQIGVRADTRQAASALRRMDQTVQKTAAGTRTLTTAQQRSQASFREVARQMGSTEAQARRLSQQNQRLARTSRDVDTRSRGLGTSLKSAAKWAGAAAAGYVGIGAAKDAISTTTELAKATIGLNRNLQFSVKVGSELAAQVKVRTGDTKGLTMVQKSLSTQIESAKKGTQSAVDAFDSLGISIKELKSLSGDQLLFAIADGAKAAGDGTERTAALGKLLGRQFGALGPLLRDGSGALKEQLKIADEAGASFKGMDITKLQELIASERKAQLTSIGLQNAFTKNLAPALIFALNALGPVIRGLGAFIRVHERAVKFIRDHATFFKVAFVPLTLGMSLAIPLIIKNWDKIKGVFGDGVSFIKKAWGGIKNFLSAPFQAAVGAIRGFINQIIGIINTVLGPIGVHIGEVGGKDTSTAGSVNQGRPGRKRRARGGGIGGSGSGDTVPAMLEPGEFVLNRKAVQRVGLEKLNALNKAVPRFQAGGEVQHLLLGGIASKATGGLPDLPGLGSIPGWLKPAGQFVLDKVGGFIKDRLTPDLSGPNIGAANGLQAGIRNILAVVLGNTSGLSISSGLRPGDSGSFHSLGRAVDLSGSPQAMLQAANWIGTHIGPALTEGIHNPNLSWDSGHRVSSGFWGASTWADHIDHIHLAKQRGGMIPNPKHGAHWIKNLGGHIDANEAATLLWQAGLSEADAGELSRVVPGESGGNPRARNPSGATGLFQILGQVFPGNLYDPRINAINAAIKWRTQGRGAWEAASSGPAGRILRDRVAGLKPGKGKSPKGKPGKGKKPKVGGGDSPIDDALSVMMDLENTRIGGINELISGENLLGMQRFGVAAAQNPLVGLGAPSRPTPMAMLGPYSPPGAVATPSDIYDVRRKKKGGVHIHNHFYIGDKEIKGITKVQMRRAARGGHRPLPSRGGGL